MQLSAQNHRTIPFRQRAVPLRARFLCVWRVPNNYNYLRTYICLGCQAALCDAGLDPIARGFEMDHAIISQQRGNEKTLLIDTWSECANSLREKERQVLGRACGLRDVVNSNRGVGVQRMTQK